MLLCTLALFAVSLGYGVVVPLLPELLHQPARASSASSLSIIYVVYAAAKIAAQVPGGAWVDAAGGRRVLRSSLALFSLSLAGFLLPGSIAWFSAVRALEGAATGLVYPAVFALVMRGAGGQGPASGATGSGKRIGLAVGIGSSGLLAGPVLGGVLLPYGARLPIAISLGVALLLTAVSFARARDDGQNINNQDAKQNDLDRNHASARDGAALPARRSVRGELRAIGALASSAAFLGLCLPIAFNKLTFTAFQGLLPLHGPGALGLQQRGVNGLFLLIGVVFALAQPLGGALVDRFAPRRIALLFTAPLLAALVAMSSCGGPLGFSIFFALYVACSSIIFTATLKQAARAFGSESTYGGVFGVLGTLTDLMTIAGPLLFLNLYPWLGARVFLAMAIAGLPFALGYLWLARGFGVARAA